MAIDPSKWSPPLRYGGPVYWSHVIHGARYIWGVSRVGTSKVRHVVLNKRSKDRHIHRKGVLLAMLDLMENPQPELMSNWIYEGVEFECADILIELMNRECDTEVKKWDSQVEYWLNEYLETTVGK